MVRWQVKKTVNIQYFSRVICTVSVSNKTPWPRSKLTKKGFLWLILPYCCSSSKEVRTRTEIGQELGGISWHRGHEEVLLPGVLRMACSASFLFIFFFFQVVNLFILHASFFFLFLLSSHFLLPSPLITTSSHPHTSNPLTPCFQYTILLFCSENGRPPLDVPVVYIVSCSKSGHLLSYWGWTREPSRIKGSQ